MEEILKLSPNALIAFGSVWAIGLRVKLTTEQKFLLSVAVAFVLGFIPSDLGNEIANRVKDAVGIGIGLTAIYQGARRITGVA